MSNDPFSDVLRLTEAKSVVAGGFAAGETWALRFAAPRQIVVAAVAKGGCWLRVDGEKERVRLEEGDVCLLPGRAGYVVGSSLTVRPTDVLVQDKKDGDLLQVGDGTACVVLACRVLVHPSSAPLLTDVLPELVHIRGANARAAALRWIVEQLRAEGTSTLPGTSIASAQLAQLLFVQVLRAHLAGSGSLSCGWLRAMGDERIVRALQLVHREPERDWRLSELAKEAGMSRTSFAIHFKAAAGVAPLAYLAEWRMRLAQRILRDEDTSVIELAQSLGYTSESAFSNAFKRITGSAPRSYRKASRLEVSSDATSPPREASQAARRSAEGSYRASGARRLHRRPKDDVASAGAGADGRPATIASRSQHGTDAHVFGLLAHSRAGRPT